MTKTRITRLTARIAPETLAIVRRAAELEGRSVSDFTVAAAQDAAMRTIEESQLIRLSVVDQRAIAQVIVSPPPLAAAMERAIDRHHKLIFVSR